MDIPFLELFPGFNNIISDDGLLRQAVVPRESVLIDRESRTLTLTLRLPAPLEPAQEAAVCDCLRKSFDLRDVRLTVELPEEASAAPECAPSSEESAPPAEKDAFSRTEALRQAAIASLPMEEKRDTSSVLYGKAVKKKSAPMATLTGEKKNVAVTGRIFFTNHREIKKRGGWVLSFDMTDETDSVRVSRFLPGEEGQPLAKKLKTGLYVTVQGDYRFDPYENDMTLTPTSIVTATAPRRYDTAEGPKRVELHLHTRMSAMDALTDTAEAVRRAAEWGHPAIAITDHGVVHSFPDAWNAAKKLAKEGKPIKILYGTEAYLVNDVDGRPLIRGTKDEPLCGTFVCFDLETTGLRADQGAITEIGAVRVVNGRVTEEFNTFADPQQPLSPEIVRLTGITEEMLRGAPSQEEALRAFLDFAGDAVLVAHNADFDVGFVQEGCDRYGIPFQPTQLDTVVLSQQMLPELRHHKLDQVASYLGLAEFRHHRASDDARTAAGILIRLFDRLREEGWERIQQLPMALAERADSSKKRGSHHLVILVKNQTGLRNLYKLVTEAHLHHFQRHPCMPKSLIDANREGLILGSACEAGELFSAIVAGRSWRALRRIAAWYDYLEIQPVCNNAFLLRNGRAKDVEQLRDFNRTVIRLAKELGKPVCATGDVHFLDPEQEIYRHILLAGQKFEDADASLPIYFKTTDEMLEEFSYLGEDLARQVVVDGPRQVADWCDEVAPLPTGLFPPSLPGAREELETLVWGRVRELYGETPPPQVTDRVEAELHDIIGCHYEVIYMSAQKLVSKSVENGYLVGSRGSVGSSVVAFFSGITEVNALSPHYRCPNCKYSDFNVDEQYGCGADMPDRTCPVCGAPLAKDGFRIPFETFLGFGGDKVPDIDLNFSGEYQARAHQDTIDLFGKDHVFRAGTIGTLQDKTVYGFVKNYLEERSLTVSRAEENRLVCGCVGVKRTTGQHPGGLVVIPQDKEIYDFCPAQHPADKADSEIVTTHFEYHAMESNLLKLDMLGHDDPSMLRMLGDLTGVDVRSIPLDDPDTMSIFKSSRVLGYENDEILGPTGATAIPEFGTSFVRGMLVDTKPEAFDILVRLSGFSHGTDVWLGNAQDLIVSGTATVGQAIGCRDDIMLYLIEEGFEPKRAFKIMEAVRKGRGLPDGAEDEMRSHGVPDWYTGSCKKIKYLFPKAHAVAYVMMAFRIAWFKVHEPLAFYAAYFSIRAKAFDARYMIGGMEAVKAKMRQLQAADKDRTAVEDDMLVTLEVCYEFYLRGFTFHSIDLYKSDATRFVIEGNGLIPPFTSVAGLGESAAQDLVAQRQGRSFVSVEEVAAACPKVSKTHIQQLAELGAFGTLPETSQLTLF